MDPFVVAFSRASFLNGEIMEAEDFDSRRDTGRRKLDVDDDWCSLAFMEFSIPFLNAINDKEILIIQNLPENMKFTPI